jgi:hypothetical protein
LVPFHQRVNQTIVGEGVKNETKEVREEGEDREEEGFLGSKS